jgi:hypothetical protein
MKVFLQRSDGLFLKSAGNWVSSRAEALEFEHCTPAIDFCVANGVKDVRLCLSFGDAKYDLYLEVFRAETRALVQFNRDLRARKDALLKQLDLVAAEAKERKKAFPFPRKSIASEQSDSAQLG